MKILVTNDDGIQAPGLWTLVEALRPVGEVTVIAPDREQSGVGSSLTLGAPLHITPLQFAPDSVAAYDVAGTPGDCVILGLGSVMPEGADLVVAGINRGHNTTNEILISGTVGAALHAALRGVPAIAVSLFLLDSAQYHIGAAAAAYLARHLQAWALPSGIILNVNIPHQEMQDIEGVMVTRLGQRRFTDTVEERDDPRGRKSRWLIRKRENIDVGEGTDLWALRQKYISVTPLDFTLSCLPASTLPDDLCGDLFQELKARLAPPA